MKQLCVWMLVFVAWSPPVAGSLISAGDLTILGYRSDNPDAFAFVTWVDLDSTTSINFWDSGYIGGGDGSGQGAGGGNWRATEGFLTWTSGVAVAAGSVVVISGNSADIGSTVGSLTGLSTSGDQIFAGQNIVFSPGGNPSTLTGALLFGLDFNDGAGWDATTTNSNDSAQPGALIGNTIAFAHVDNGQYTGSRAGVSVSQLKSLISNSSNWTFSDSGSGFGSLDSTDFSFGSVVPEPTGFSLFAGGLLLMTAGSRRRRRE